VHIATSAGRKYLSKEIVEANAVVPPSSFAASFTSLFAAVSSPFASSVSSLSELADAGAGERPPASVGYVEIIVWGVEMSSDVVATELGLGASPALWSFTSSVDIAGLYSGVRAPKQRDLCCLHI
jgi:hypothetical protein